MDWTKIKATTLVNGTLIFLSQPTYAIYYYSVCFNIFISYSVQLDDKKGGCVGF